MAISRAFRTCPDSGLVFHRPAENLIKANAVAGVVALLIGGFLGLLLLLTRWQAVHLLPADSFYQVLTAHGITVLLFWILFFEMAILYFASSTLLRARLATPRMGWLAFALMVIGAVVTNIAIMQGGSTVMMTSYVPMPAEPSFYLGLILFAVGALIGCFIFFGTLVIAREERTYENSIPLVTFGALTAAIIAVYSIASGAIILIPTYLWSVGYISEIDPLMYRIIWWGIGHGSQQVNVAAHVSIWYLVAGVIFGARPLSEKVSRTAFLLYILFLQLAAAHHLLVDPGVGSEWKVFNTSYAIYLAVLASLIHGLTVPGGMEVAQREKGYNRGLFEWLRKAPWGNPVFSGTFLSILIFGILGGISGVVMGTEQLNLLFHNTLYVPGHFHATVVGGTTLAFMALTYYLLPILFRRRIAWSGLASWQPYLFGIGVSIFAIFMMGAGTLGVSRRHWDITFAQSQVLGYDYPGVTYLMLGLMALGGLVMVIGGALFCLQAVATILFGERLDPNPYEEAQPAMARAGPGGVIPAGVGVGGFAAPGMLLIAVGFLAAFVIYYFINWKYLAALWPLG